jgi:predicted ATP-dependent serine protease
VSKDDRPTYKFQIELKEGQMKPLQYDQNKVMRRLEERGWTPRRYKTGLPVVDKVLGGGLSNGLTMFIGPAGCGKTRMAHSIVESIAAMFPDDIDNDDPRVLYVCTESLADDPGRDISHVADYTIFIPNWERAINELFGLITELKVDVAVVDSVTNFLSSTRKAVDEADVRAGLRMINSLADRHIPIIGISQIRGSGQYQHPAGGHAVDHAANMVVNFEKKAIEASWDVERYGESLGAVAWTLQVMKDKLRAAKQDTIHKVVYDKKGIPSLRDLTHLETARKQARGAERKKSRYDSRDD